LVIVWWALPPSFQFFLHTTSLGDPLQVPPTFLQDITFQSNWHPHDRQETVKIAEFLASRPLSIFRLTFPADGNSSFVVSKEGPSISSQLSNLSTLLNQRLNVLVNRVGKAFIDSRKFVSNNLQEGQALTHRVEW
jgi:hypothetical protein